MASNTQLSRRVFCLTVISALCVATGCSTFGSKKKTKRTEDEFALEEEDFEDDEDTRDHVVFSSERKKQKETSDFLAQQGRGSKEKSKVRPGDDFLLSSKAKEIYANTER
ncbi:MAG: hypothetical protein Q4G03_05650 [Planctomycetia bacterium]|nr:hypothetical protein [Planctomycetia bacterium]